MPRLGILSVTLVAKTGRFRRNVGGAKRDLLSFSGTVGVTKRALGSLAAGFLGFRGITGLIDKLRTSFQRLEDVTRTAGRLGLGVKQLQVLQEAARRTSIPVNTLNLGLQRMVRRIGQAADGTGEAVDALFELGLSARRLRNENDTAAAFSEVIDALGQQENAFKRTALAQKIFDSEGVRLVDLAEMGSTGFARLRSEMEASGQLMSSSLTKKILDANEAMAKLTANTRAFFDVLAVKLAPIITRTANAINDMTTAIAASPLLVTALKQTGFEVLSSATSLFGTLPNNVSRDFDATAAEFEQLGVMQAQVELMRQQLEATRAINVGAQ